MAQDAGLFGLQPYQIQQQQFADDRAAAQQFAQMNAAQRGVQGLYQGGAGLMRAAAPALGLVDPQMAQAQRTEALMGASGTDLQSAEGLMAKAKQFADAGDQRTAFMLVAKARELKAQESKMALEQARTVQEGTKAALDIAQAKKALREDPNLIVTEVGVPGKPGWMQKVMVDKTDRNSQGVKVGEPYMTPAAVRNETKVVQEAPVTPVTIQSPDNPDATIIIDGRTGKVLGKGPKLSDTGKVNVKTMQAASGVNSLLDQAENLLSGKATGKVPTGSLIGAGQDAIANLWGGAPEGATEAAQMKMIGGALVGKVPRFEGPQSDKDTLLYKQMAGQLGDSTISVEIRRKALQTMRDIYAGYEDGTKGRIVTNDSGTALTGAKPAAPKPSATKSGATVSNW